jgi:hypothetical protein
MNERIKELLKQSCGFEYDEDGDELTPILVGKDLAKFAELIVRECASMSRVFQSSEYDFTGDLDLDEFMLKHFGVEE